MMTKTPVFYAPVPAVILASAQKLDLAKPVAFGSEKVDLNGPPGIGVYIYASKRDTDPPHALHKPGLVTWFGKLRDIVPAIKGGRRDGKHPDPAIRPPYAEDTDTASIWFWEVSGLVQLENPIRFDRFEHESGGKAFGGNCPQYPILAVLKSE